MQEAEKALWALANALTGFAVLQAIAFLFALGSNEFRENVQEFKWVVVFTVVFFSKLYIVMVVFLYNKAQEVSKLVVYNGIWRPITIG